MKQDELFLRQDTVLVLQIFNKDGFGVRERRFGYRKKSRRRRRCYGVTTNDADTALNDDNTKISSLFLESLGPIPWSYVSVKYDSALSLDRPDSRYCFTANSYSLLLLSNENSELQGISRCGNKTENHTGYPSERGGKDWQGRTVSPRNRRDYVMPVEDDDKQSSLHYCCFGPMIYKWYSCCVYFLLVWWSELHFVLV